jgi:hypothetical protein
MLTWVECLSKGFGMAAGFGVPLRAIILILQRWWTRDSSNRGLGNVPLKTCFKIVRVMQDAGNQQKFLGRS